MKTKNAAKILMVCAVSLGLPMMSLMAQEATVPQQTETATDTLPPFEDYLPEPDVPVEQQSADPALAGDPANLETPALPEEEFPEVKADIEESENGFLLTDASLNDVFSLLAEEASRQYFHNPRLAGDEYRVTGRLIPGKALEKMDELAFQYGLEMYERGNTVYALTKEQLVDLPSKEWHYKLRYLRPSDINELKTLVQTYLSPGTGLVNYEGKSNTLIVVDTPTRIEKVQTLFEQIDKPAGQIVIEVKILNVKSSVASRLGANWSGSLGLKGLASSTLVNLNSLLGIDVGTATTVGSGSDFVLSNLQLSSVLRALNEGGLVTQKSNPVVITEDNEEAVISLIDRIPIITSQTTATQGNTTITESVRYKIDAEDPSGHPASTRELGITFAVTPTRLPDGTIRMQMRPRSAQVTGEVIGVTGNRYPEVKESMIQTIARIPDGHSMLVGGFYGEVKSKDGTKVPFLGDIPGLNFFFKSKETIKEHSSLIFVVTPKSYSPEDQVGNYQEHNRLQQNLAIPYGHDWVNTEQPGKAHEADYCRTMNAINRDLRRETYREPKPLSTYEVQLRESLINR